MYVTFNVAGGNSKIMLCFYSNINEQSKMMHNQDIKEQVLEWLETNSGNPPRFSSRIRIEEFITDKEASRRKIKY